MKLPGPLNAEQEKQLRIVQTGAKHLLSLINDLLDVAKLSANKVTLNLEPVDCKTLIEEVSATLELEARRKGLAFAVHTPPVDVLLLTERRALSQILINLVGNAIKFTHQIRHQPSVALEHSFQTRHLQLMTDKPAQGPGAGQDIPRHQRA